jgi:hypothetical protein
MGFGPMIIGFSGTRGLSTAAQRASFKEKIAELKPDEFHHGDCIGWDVMADFLIQKYSPQTTIVVHPPVNETYRANCGSNRHIFKRAKPYLVRNRNIVSAANMMLFCPGQSQEKLRSGTWSTVRYARKVGKAGFILLPNGDVETL